MLLNCLLLLLVALQIGGSSLPVSVAQSPEAAIGRFVELNNHRQLASPEAQKLLTGELADMTSPGVGELPQADKVIAMEEGKAVARIPAADGNPDMYFYLEKGREGWSIGAMRALALTGPIEELRRLLKAQPQRSAEEEEMLKNLELVLATDRALLQWSAAHRDLLERARAAPSSPEVERALKGAGATGARDENGIIIVSIGGMLDNEVGFLFAPDGNVPSIDATNYIWIEPAGGGWHLFKTT